jgi:hypothetical protein
MRSIVLLVGMGMVGCGTVLAPHDGQDGAQGPMGAMGPPGDPAVRGDDRLRPLYWTTVGGAKVWSGWWEDGARGEECKITELDSGARCLPKYRTQTAFPAYVEPTCEGARASAVFEPGYIHEIESGSFFKLGQPISEAWVFTSEGCGPAAPGSWYQWDPVAWETFVPFDLAE